MKKVSPRKLRSHLTLKVEPVLEDRSDIHSSKPVSQNKQIFQKVGSRQVRKIKQESQSQSQPVLQKIKLENNYEAGEVLSLQVQGLKKQQKSPRKRKVPIESAKIITEKIIKIKEDNVKVPDIEEASWEPENWKVVLENILKMRKLHVAPVDSLGCEECPDKSANPEVFRYQTLISVMLSSQTKDEVTYAATQRLIQHGLTIDSILNTSDEIIGKLIYPAGFWKSKVQYIKKTTQILKDQYNGDIPRTLKELCKLPGVGPKMANITMSVAWNDTVGIAVDTHVHRISNRLGWLPKPTKDPEQTRKALESWLPKNLWKDVSLNMVGFGQTICRPIRPKCQDCINTDLCPFYKNERK